MPREKAFYRENLEQILDFTGGVNVLTMTQLKSFTGIKDTRTLKKRFPLTHNTISAATLAGCLAVSGGEAP